MTSVKTKQSLYVIVLTLLPSLLRNDTKDSVSSGNCNSRKNTDVFPVGKINAKIDKTCKVDKFKTPVEFQENKLWHAPI